MDDEKHRWLLSLPHKRLLEYLDESKLGNGSYDPTGCGHLWVSTDEIAAILEEKSVKISINARSRRKIHKKRRKVGK